MQVRPLYEADAAKPFLIDKKKNSKTGIFILAPIKVFKSRFDFFPFTYCMDLREGFIKVLERRLLLFGHDPVVF